MGEHPVSGGENEPHHWKWRNDEADSSTRDGRSCWLPTASVGTIATLKHRHPSLTIRGDLPGLLGLLGFLYTLGIFFTTGGVGRR